MPGTAHNKTGESESAMKDIVLSPSKSHSSHLETDLCFPHCRNNLPVCHTNFSRISSIYFQSSRKRHLLHWNPFPRHAYVNPLKDQEHHDYFISQRCENPCQINASSFRLTTVLLCWDKGQVSWDVSLLLTPKPLLVSYIISKKRFWSAASCHSADTHTVVIISLTMMTVKILQLLVKTHK